MLRLDNDHMTGEATVGPDGTVTGRITFDAESLSTKNKQRDKHVRHQVGLDTGRHLGDSVCAVCCPGTSTPLLN